MERRISFPSRDGLLLEGLVDEGEDGRHGWVILCHPHPLYGGDMDSSVVHALQSVLTARGFSTLRFNFRGVGGSGGVYGEGVAEVQDVHGALDFVAAKDVTIYLVGYSFGAYVGSLGIVNDSRVRALGCVSPPVEMYDFTFLMAYENPALFVAGDQDFVCPVQKLTTVFNAVAQPKTLQIIPGADHFWWGFEHQLAHLVAEFLEDL